MNENVIDEPAYRNKVMVFKDRIHAGRLLGKKLRDEVLPRSICLLGLPAGGVPVAYEVSQALSASLDVAIVRKMLLPWNSEAGYGAVSWTGKVVLNQEMIRCLRLSDDIVDAGIRRTERNVIERLRKFRGARPPPVLNGRSVILVDDGLASGFTMIAAVRSIRDESPERMVVAVPTGSRNAVDLVSNEVDIVVCLNIREGSIFAVADAYEHWYDLKDEEVIEFLRKAWSERT